MRDARVDSLARILVHYSTEVTEGETCLIEGPSAGEPLIAAVYEEVLKAGGHPVVAISTEGQTATFFKHASDAQLDWVSPLAEWAADASDCRIGIGAEANTRELSGVPPERQSRRRKATRHLMEKTLRRDAEGSTGGSTPCSRPTATPPTPR